MIPVTKPFLPPIEEYQEYVKLIWERNWLTNNGPILVKLENELCHYLNVLHILFVGNGTIALQIAIKALSLKGEIITTPFSYVATTSSIVWEGCTPVFVDIDKDTLNIDPSKIESSINEKTSAILATHVYGNPCDVEKIQTIADKYKLKVIYDAAHCFGVKYKGRSIFEYGNVSTTSFHATKIFHSVEGGAIFTPDDELFNIMAYMRNFGHETLEEFAGLGINGKNSELHAAMGLINLKYINAIIEKRKQLSLWYDNYLCDCDILKPSILSECEYNYAYYPIIIKNEILLKSIIKELNKNSIYPRRYFYPSLDTLPYLEVADLPITKDISKRILCLPMYHTLEKKDVSFVAKLVSHVLNMQQY